MRANAPIIVVSGSYDGVSRCRDVVTHLLLKQGARCNGNKKKKLVTTSSSTSSVFFFLNL